MSEVLMYLKYDPEADAAYLYLRPHDQDMRASMTAPVDTTDTGRMINLDFDDAYRLVGIEIMDASATLAGSGLITRASANPGLGTTVGDAEGLSRRQPPESDKREGPAGQDPGWASAFRARCDPVMARAGFEGQTLFGDHDKTSVVGVVWLADRHEFRKRYPGSAESAGPANYPAPSSDINCEVTVDGARRCLHLWLEAWNLPVLALPLSTNGDRDGAAVAGVLGRLLSVGE